MSIFDYLVFCVANCHISTRNNLFWMWNGNQCKSFSMFYFWINIEITNYCIFSGWTRFFGHLWKNTGLKNTHLYFHILSVAIFETLLFPFLWYRALWSCKKFIWIFWFSLQFLNMNWRFCWCTLTFRILHFKM